jgi:hypothetical protein
MLDTNTGGGHCYQSFSPHGVRFLVKTLITKVTVIQEELLIQVALLVSIITFKTLLEVSMEQDLVDVTSIEVMNMDTVGMDSVIPHKNGWLYLKKNALKCFA